MIGSALKICFQQEMFILNDFWKQKMEILTMDKKHFVRADGRGISNKGS